MPLPQHYDYARSALSNVEPEAILQAARLAGVPIDTGPSLKSAVYRGDIVHFIRHIPGKKVPSVVGELGFLGHVDDDGNGITGYPGGPSAPLPSWARAARPDETPAQYRARINGK